MQGQAPLLTLGNSVFEKINLNNICAQLFDSRCLFSNSDPFRQGKMLTASCLLRGLDLSTYEAENALMTRLKQHKEAFVQWIPDSVMTSISQVPAANQASNVSGSLLTNSSAIACGFDQLVQQFEKMFAKKAFVHQYTAEGMDTSEFYNALSNVKDLISEYQQYSNAEIYEEDMENEEMDLVEALKEDNAKPSMDQLSAYSGSTKASMNGSL